MWTYFLLIDFAHSWKKERMKFQLSLLLIQASIQKECIKFNYMNHKQTWKIRTRRTHARKLETFCVLLSCLMCDCSFIFFSEYFVQHDSAGESLLVSSKNIEKNSHEFCAELLQQKVNCTIFWPQSLSRYTKLYKLISKCTIGTVFCRTPVEFEIYFLVYKPLKWHIGTIFGLK